MPTLTSAVVHGTVAIFVLAVCVHMWLLLSDDIDRFWQHMLGMFGGSALAITIALVGVEVAKVEKLGPKNAARTGLSTVVVQTCWAALAGVFVLLAICVIRQEVLRAAVYALALTLTFWLTTRVMALHTLLDGWTRIGKLTYVLMAIAACPPIYEVCQRGWQNGLRSIVD